MTTLKTIQRSIERHALRDAVYQLQQYHDIAYGVQQEAESLAEHLKRIVKRIDDIKAIAPQVDDLAKSEKAAVALINLDSDVTSLSIMASNLARKFRELK